MMRYKIRITDHMIYTVMVKDLSVVADEQK